AAPPPTPKSSRPPPPRPPHTPNPPRAGRAPRPHPRARGASGSRAPPRVLSGTRPKVGAMPGLRVLFLGGTGIISSAGSRLAVERGIDLFLLNRGQSTDRPPPPEATVLRGDARDPASVREALGGREFDAVVDWVAYTPVDVQTDIAEFRG